jgi:dihydroneopterin aldolase / 2-amino-4-hydroxy-6-hydroxymethyldihydropteridine diphosphokinase
MVILSLGGNLGDTAATFRTAEAALAAGGVRIKRVSPIYRNPAVGCEEGAPDFSNIAILCEWDGTPEELLDLTQSIEVQCGRPADHPHWHSRTLDIDIIECNGVHCNTPRLTLPHPRWQERDFVKIPIAALNVSSEITAN